MTLTQERGELEAAVQTKLREMLEENLPTIRARLRAAMESESSRRAADAQRLLDRLEAEFGPDPQHVQS